MSIQHNPKKTPKNVTSKNEKTNLAFRMRKILLNFYMRMNPPQSCLRVQLIWPVEAPERNAAGTTCPTFTKVCHQLSVRGLGFLEPCVQEEGEGQTSTLSGCWAWSDGLTMATHPQWSIADPLLTLYQWRIGALCIVVTIVMSTCALWSLSRGVPLPCVSCSPWRHLRPVGLPL